MFDELLLLLLLLLVLTIDLTSNQIIGNLPILAASPYPFKTSESARVKCFTNEQGILLSVMITADLIDLDANSSALRATEKEISNNGSVTLDIVAPFNYSRLESKITCRSTFHHGVEKTTELDVLSVAEILPKDALALQTQPNQEISLHCRTYGTDVGELRTSREEVSFHSRDSRIAIHWDFTATDLSTNNFSRLPLGIRLDHRYTTNDTLIIPRVSHVDHHGHYRCLASNELLGRLYEDQRIISLTVQKRRIWIPILIVCLVAGLCILLLIVCSRYCRNRRKKTPKTNESVSKDESIGEEKNVIRLPQLSSSSPWESLTPRFVLGNPFIDADVQPIDQ